MTMRQFGPPFESNPAAAVVAGETRAEVRGDARRRDGQERRHRPQAVRREGRRKAAAGGAAQAAAATHHQAQSAAAGGADAVGDVRPAVVAAVDVVGVLDDHRELHGVVRRAAGEQTRLDAVLRMHSTDTDRPPAQKRQKRKGECNACVPRIAPVCQPEICYDVGVLMRP